MAAAFLDRFRHQRTRLGLELERTQAEPAMCMLGMRVLFPHPYRIG